MELSPLEQLLELPHEDLEPTLVEELDLVAMLMYHGKKMEGRLAEIGHQVSDCAEV